MSGDEGQEPAVLPPAAPVPEAVPAPRRHRLRGWWWRWPFHTLIILVEWGFFTVAILSALLAWRLAQGPLDLSWALPRVSRIVAVAAPELDLSIGHLAVAWAGFRQGPDQPVQVTSDAISLDDRGQDRSLRVNHLAVDLSMAWAVRKVFAPRVITLDGVQITLRRAPPVQEVAETARERAQTGTPRAMARDIIAALRQPPQRDTDLLPVEVAQLSELHRITLTDSSVTLQPANGQEGATGLAGKALQIGDIGVTLVRGELGGLTGDVDAVLASRAGPLPPQTAGARPSLHVNLTVSPQGAVHMDSTATLDDPAGMFAAIQLPADLPVPAFPLQLATSLDASADAHVTAYTLGLSGGAGKLLVDNSSLPVASLALTLSGDEDHLTVDPSSHLALAPVSDQPPPTFAFSGQGSRDDHALTITLGLGLDHVASNDLAAYWPPDFAKGAQRWVTAQVKNGGVHDGTLRVVLKGKPDFSDLDIASLSGTLPAQGLTVAWLPPMPPLTAVEGAVIFQGTDAVLINVAKAKQGNLAVSNSSMLITGLSAEDQIGSIDLNLAGPVATAMALVGNPRLHLLTSLPVPLNVTAGTLQGNVRLSLPLDANVTMDQITMQTHDVIQNLALSGLVLGRSLSQGNLTIDASLQGLHLAGSAALAAIPANVTLDTDFTAGPPTGVIARLHVTATADQRQLAAAGIPTGGVLSGAASLDTMLAAQRNGRTDINLVATLPESRLSLSQIAWTGGAGTATATAHLALQGSRIVALDNLALTGPSLALKVRSGFAGGQLSTVTVDTLQLGRTDLHGSLGLPAAPGAPYVIDIAGRALDISGLFGGGRKVGPSVKPANQALSTISSREEFAPHPPWRATVNLDRLIFGTTPGGQFRELDNVRGSVVNNGVIVQSADVALTVAPSAAATRLSIVPQPNGTRAVHLSSGDLGGLLKATNAYDAITGGVLDITGTYNDRLPNHPLSGDAEMDKFSLGEAPTVAKMLQAMTLYGVVDLMHGPGLFFSKLEAPFRLADRRLELSEARAYSASLGLTADGSVDLPRNAFNIQGTIVPAYFFNSLLGHIPLIGKLFSPEKGGGLFAAKYQLVGPINNPQVHVNALSAIAPGILRDLFSHGPAQPTPPATGSQ